MPSLVDPHYLLHKASGEGNVHQMKELIPLVQNVNYSVKKGRKSLGSPLTEASRNGHLAAMQILLAVGADLNREVVYGTKRKHDYCTALTEAVLRGDGASVEWLAFNGATVDKKLTNGKTALYYATVTLHSHCLKILFEYGANIGARCHQLTPLALALTEPVVILDSQFEFVATLLALGVPKSSRVEAVERFGNRMSLRIARIFLRYADEDEIPIIAAHCPVTEGPASTARLWYSLKT